MTDSKIDQLKKLVGKNPDNPLGRYGLANEYYKEGQFENTIRELEIYFKIKDDEGAAYRLLAECYSNLGDKEKAIEAYKKGIKQALKHGHPSMAEDFEEALEDI